MTQELEKYRKAIGSIEINDDELMKIVGTVKGYCERTLDGLINEEKARDKKCNHLL